MHRRRRWGDGCGPGWIVLAGIHVASAPLRARGRSRARYVHRRAGADGAQTSTSPASRTVTWRQGPVTDGGSENEPRSRRRQGCLPRELAIRIEEAASGSVYCDGSIVRTTRMEPRDMQVTVGNDAGSGAAHAGGDPRRADQGRGRQAAGGSGPKHQDSRIPPGEGARQGRRQALRPAGARRGCRRHRPGVAHRRAQPGAASSRRPAAHRTAGDRRRRRGELYGDVRRVAGCFPAAVRLGRDCAPGGHRHGRGRRPDAGDDAHAAPDMEDGRSRRDPERSGGRGSRKHRGR